MKSKFISVLFVLSAIFLAFGISVFAQGTTSRVTGTVTDSSGAVVADANITLTNQGTNTSLTTQTSNSGVYVFDLVLPGTYTVTVEKTGFKKFVSTNNAVLVNQPATINVAMQIGDVSATVTVESSAEIVQTSTSGNVGTTIDQVTIESLPIVGARGRNPLDLLNFQPGIVSGANTGGGVHVHGSRDRSFNFTLDGIDINESTAGGSNFTPLRPNPDSIQEFQVVTGNFTAELGRSSGAQVTFVTRSGTNKFRGNIFEYYQTPDFHANEYEIGFFGLPKRQFVQHIFGGSFGGPLFNPGFGEGTPFFDLLKDRAFFFVNMQFLRSNESRLVQRIVYTQTARTGLFRYVQNGRNFPAGTATPSIDFNGNPLFANCPTPLPTTGNCIAGYNIAANPSGTGIDTRLLGIINSMPLPNDFSVGDGLNTAGFNFSAPQREKQYDFVSRFDFKINDKNQFYIRYAQGEQNTIGDAGNGGLRAFPDTVDLVNTYRQPRNLAINYRWSPQSNLTNEFIFGLSTFSFSFDTPTPDPTYNFGFNTIPNTNFNFGYNARSARTLQFVDNMTYIVGSHTLKGGINFRFGKQFDDRSGVAGTQIEPFASLALGAGNNTFTGFNLPTTGINSNDATTLQNQINNFLGRVNTYSQGFVADPNGSAFLPGGSRWNFTAFYKEYDFYIQDTWKARSNLTVDLGLRFELKLAPSSEGYPILRLNQPVGSAYPASSTLAWQEGRLFKNDLNNYSPSIGAAWDPFGDGKTSIRANYRLAYDRFATFLFGSSIFQSAPGNTTSVTANGGLVRNLGTLFPTSTPNALRQPVLSNGSITVIDQNLQFPEIHQWFAGVQRDIGFNTVIEVNYVGRRGTHLIGGYDANQVNISSTDPRCGGQTFLQAFIQAQDAAGAANPNCLASLLVGGAANGSSAAFRTAFLTQLNQNAVGTVAQTLAQRTGATAITGFGFNQFFFQKYPQFRGSLNVIDSSDVSRYNGLEIIAKRRITKGIGFQVGYTYSISKDTRSFDPAFTVVSRGAVQSASSTPFDNNNRRLNYAWSDFDRRHALQATYVVELPFGRGRAFGSDMPKALDFIVGGWQVAGNLLLVSGRPFTIYSGFNTFSNAVSSLANCNGCTRNMGSVIQNLGTNYFFDPTQLAQFTVPAPGEIGNTGRNFFIGPSEFRTDISLSKKFKFTERFSFDLRVDARNLTNTPSFANPNANLTSTAAPFGRIRESVVSSSRKIQFSGKFSF